MCLQFFLELHVESICYKIETNKALIYVTWTPKMLSHQCWILQKIHYLENLTCTIDIIEELDQHRHKLININIYSCVLSFPPF